MTSSRIAAIGLAFAVLGVTVAGPAAEAQPYPPPPYHHHHYRHYVRYDRYGRRCEDYRRSRANTGTAIGAVSGGILGSALGGGRLGSTLLGAGAGAVAGHAIAKDGVRC